MENYQKNRWCIQEVMDKLLRHMKGYDYSFKAEITDKRGNFSNEKLHGLVDQLLIPWSGQLRAHYYTAGENVAEPYLQDRLPIYRLYLYLVMRCSLCTGAYAHVLDTIDCRLCEGVCGPSCPGVKEKERPDFAYLLEQAQRLFRNWCVIAEPNGDRHNELHNGYDKHFGFHLYQPFTDPEGTTLDSALTPEWKLTPKRDASMTDEGNVKPILLVRFPGKRRPVKPQAEEVEKTEETTPPDEAGYDGASGEDDGADDYDTYDDYGPEEDYDTEEDYSWSILDELDEETRYAFEIGEMERATQRDNRAYWLLQESWIFDCREEYLSACDRFVKLFEKAKPEVLRSFYDDLEEIVDLYLVSRGIPPLMDTDQTLDVYNRLLEGPYRQAKRYARGIQWKNL